MFWQDDEQNENIDSDDVVDLLFSIECKHLPVDHAYDLSSAILQILPWLAEEPCAAIHQIHVAASQNGWERPDSGELCLSRRTKMTIRVPAHRIDDTEELVGQTLDIAGNRLKIGKSKQRELSPLTTIFTRYLVAERLDDENTFLQRQARILGEKGITIRKALCGIAKDIATPEGPIPTRSLMLAELSVEESLQLQKEGLGPHRMLGCGIFTPHKGIDAVKKTADDASK